MDFNTKKTKLLMAANPDEFSFNWCRFANDTRVVCSIRSYFVLKAGQIGAGIRAYRDGRTVGRRLLAIDTDGENQIQLVPEAKTRVGGKLVWNAVNQDTVISWLNEDPKHILIQLNREDRTRPTVYKLNIYTNKMRRVQGFMQSVLRWYADSSDGTLLFATGRRSDTTPVVYSLLNDKRQEINLKQLGGVGTPNVHSITADAKSAWVFANNGKNTEGLHKIDLATGNVTQTLFEHESYDAYRLVTHPQTSEPVSVSFKSGHEETIWHDDTVAAHIAAIRQVTGNPTYVHIQATDADMSHMVVYTEGNGTHPAHFLYAFADQSIRQLSKLDQGKPVEFEYVSYKARDGMQIPAYVALPGPKEEGPYPTVIRPHGGPWSRDDDTQYFITQFLIDRGYAVLKPNFRGSSGYGDRYMRAGFDQWGLQMQDDVIDGLKWMVDSGFSDPDRVCIAGGSYGGYVSLVAAYKTPQLFKCAVSFAGVANLEDLVQRTHRYQFGRLTSARIQKGAAMAANSPVNFADKIAIPLLIVHGDVDTTVVVDQSKELVSALETAGKPHIYIEQSNGDHHFSLQSHRMEYLQALESFLAKHIGAE